MLGRAKQGSPGNEQEDQLTEENSIILHLASDQASEGGLALGLGERGNHIAWQLASKFAHHSRIGSSSEERWECLESTGFQVLEFFLQSIHTW